MFDSLFQIAKVELNSPYEDVRVYAHTLTINRAGFYFIAVSNNGFSYISEPHRMKLSLLPYKIQNILLDIFPRYKRKTKESFDLKYEIFIDNMVSKYEKRKKHKEELEKNK